MKRFFQIICLLLGLLLLPDAFAVAEETCQLRIVSVSTEGAVIRAEADDPITAYCITTQNIVPDAAHPDWRPCSGTGFSAFKMDGTYYVRVRNEAGDISPARKVTVASGFAYRIEAEGLQYLDQPIETALSEQGDSIDQANADIAFAAKEAGLYTPEAVASVCMTLLTRLSEYGLTLSYQPSGDFTAQEDWGLSPIWGTKMKREESDYAGTYTRYSMECRTIIVWAYKQAGLNLQNSGRRGIFDVGRNRRRGDNQASLDAGDTGDIIATSTGHTMLILDRVDTDRDGLSDSYLVFEMESPYLKLKIRSLYSVRLCTLYDMKAVFSDTGALKSETKYWEGSFHIPQEALPAYYERNDGTWLLARRRAAEIAARQNDLHPLQKDAPRLPMPEEIPDARTVFEPSTT